MSVFQLEALKARHGDALLLQVGREDKPDIFMIDGGAARVYDKTLEPRLKELRGGSTDPLPIRLLVVSHIDDDHINGVLRLTQALIEDENGSKLVDVKELWHNSLADTIAKIEDTAAPAAVEASALKVASFADTDLELAEALGAPSRMVLESVRQGRQLRNDAEKLHITVNKGFDCDLVLREAAPTPVKRRSLSLTVLGPSQKQVDKLQDRWVKDLKKILAKEEDKAAAAQAARSLDTSVFNLASIVLLAEFEGKSMLLTGDARGDMILEWLEEAELLEDGPLHVNLLKLPHHGSDRNVEPEFFERVRADHYLFSGDGKHGNPEPNTFDMLFAARVGDTDYTVHMTYGPGELKESDDFNYTDFEKVLNKHPGSRDRLNFPTAGEKSVVISL